MTSQPSRFVRLVTEAAVIVLSILLAFAIDAWWDERQERARVVGQLAQVEIDLRSTLANLDDYGRTAESARDANRRLVEARLNPTLVPVDSASALFSRAWVHSGAEPRFESVRSLVQTGDIALIEDSTLQGAMTIYLARIQESDRYENQVIERFGEAASDLFDYIDLADAVSLSIDASGLIDIGLPWDAHSLEYVQNLDRRGFNERAHREISNPAVQRILSRMLGHKTDIALQQGQMREATEQLLDLVVEARRANGSG